MASSSPGVASTTTSPFTACARERIAGLMPLGVRTRSLSAARESGEKRARNTAAEVRMDFIFVFGC